MSTQINETIPAKPTQKDFETRNEYVKAWYAWKYKYDPKYGMLRNIYSQTNSMMRAIMAGKQVKHSWLLDCGSEKFRKHLQKHFKQGMKWSNYGTVWELDHIVSLMDAYKENGLEGMELAASYKNIRPELVKVNRAGKKGKGHSTDVDGASRDNIIVRFGKTHIEVKVLEGRKWKGKTVLMDSKYATELNDKSLYFSDATIYIYTKGNGSNPQTLFSFVTGKAPEGLKYKKTSGKANDYRAQCFETYDPSENRRIAWRKAARKQYEKNKEIYNARSEACRVKKLKAQKQLNEALCKQLREEFEEKSLHGISNERNSR